MIARFLHADERKVGAQISLRQNTVKNFYQSSPLEGMNHGQGNHFPCWVIYPTSISLKKKPLEAHWISPESP